VQWVAATASGAKRDAAALANVQRLDKDNGAAWALSLDDAGTDAQRILQNIAASHRYDEHTMEIIPIWIAAVKRHPLPVEMIERVQQQMPEAKFTPDDLAASTAVMMTTMTTIETSPYARINAACANADDRRKAPCVATGRLMFDRGRSLMTVVMGEMLLRKFDALSADDRLRSRNLAWWRENSMSLLSAGDAAGLYMRDVLATGSEIEALGLAATRAGKAEPPADWKSASEKAAAKDEARKAAAAAH